MDVARDALRNGVNDERFGLTVERFAQAPLSPTLPPALPRGGGRGR